MREMIRSQALNIFYSLVVLGSPGKETKTGNQGARCKSMTVLSMSCSLYILSLLSCACSMVK